MKRIILVTLVLFSSFICYAQPCIMSGNTTLSTTPNTYYPGVQAVVSAGAMSIEVGAAGAGTTPISSGDIILIIQMQGTQIDSADNDRYGDGVAGGYANGYLTNTDDLAGNMEYAIAGNNVPLSGGTLNVITGLSKSYRNTDYTATGQYRYQVIRVPVYYDAELTSDITAPQWNGRTGGVIAIHARNNFSFNGFAVEASGKGFRGGAGKWGAWSTNLNAPSFASSASIDISASKGEGIAGTPRLVNNNGVLLDNGTGSEGYPGGSKGQGAPGNAGGGSTDGNPDDNETNSGGGGGGNGGIGGKGGNTWNTNLPFGGEPGKVFGELTTSRLVMGGGGGAGGTNNGTGNMPEGFSSSGAAGGGIIILRAGSITSAGFLKANGATADGSVDFDGSGGGGAGGSILVMAGTGNDNITAFANGGAGGNNAGGAIYMGPDSATAHGPGGGGGGGVIYAAAPLNAASTVNGGQAGYTITLGENYGAGNGSSGVMIITTPDQFPSVPNSCSTLPVKLLTFTCNEGSGGVQLHWTVTNEENVKEYQLERSADGTGYRSFGKVQANPSTEVIKKYSYTDSNVSTSTVYYRLKTVDLDGKYAYSAILLYRPKNKTNEGAISVFPNPVVNNNADLLLPRTLISKQLIVKIVNADGRLLAEQQLIPTSNIIKLNIPASVHGMAVVQVFDTADKTVLSYKMIVR